MSTRIPTVTLALTLVAILLPASAPPAAALSTSLLPMGSALPAATTPPAGTGASATSLPVIERQVMCVTCKIPLNVAESPQADRERALIRTLIAEGESEAQVKNALVGQYGPAVLGLPTSKGFDLAAYLVPVAMVLALLGLLVLLLPNWRRHARANATIALSAPELSEGDAARLDADLKRFD